MNDRFGGFYCTDAESNALTEGSESAVTSSPAFVLLGSPSCWPEKNFFLSHSSKERKNITQMSTEACTDLKTRYQFLVHPETTATSRQHWSSQQKSDLHDYLISKQLCGKKSALVGQSAYASE